MKDKSKTIIILSICMIIFELIIAIISKNITYMVLALMWGLVGTIEYTNTKIIEMKNEEIEINKKTIKYQSKIIISQNDAINNLLEGKNDTVTDDEE